MTTPPESDLPQLWAHASARDLVRSRSAELGRLPDLLHDAAGGQAAWTEEGLVVHDASRQPSPAVGAPPAVRFVRSAP